MESDKYYDWTRQIPLTMDQGCAYDAWLSNPEIYSFALHPEGFLVFLRANELSPTDEYVAGDPYRFREEYESAFNKRRFHVTIDFVRKALEGRLPNAKILDIGCGEGFITNEIHNAFPTVEMSGIDCSLTAIKHAKKEFPGIDFIVGDAFDLPYRKDYFDVVVCNNIWEHVSDPLRMLLGIKKILKPRGQLIISTPSRYRFENLIRALLGRRITFVSRRHVTEYTVGQVVEQLKFGGFGFECIDKERSKGEGEWKGLKGLIAYGIVLPFVRLYLNFINSQNSLATTVFYLFRKL